MGRIEKKPVSFSEYDPDLPVTTQLYRIVYEQDAQRLSDQAKAHLEKIMAAEMFYVDAEELKR